MKGCRPRRGGEFKEVFLLVVLLFLTNARTQETRSSRFRALMSLSKQLEPLCPMLVFCKLQQEDQWTEPDNVRDKHAARG